MVCDSGAKMAFDFSALVLDPLAFGTLPVMFPSTPYKNAGRNNQASRRKGMEFSRVQHTDGQDYPGTLAFQPRALRF